MERRTGDTIAGYTTARCLLPRLLFMLEREEYIEQAYLFKALGERMRENMATQDLLLWIKEEILSTTRLPMAMDFLAAELKLQGRLPRRWRSWRIISRRFKPMWLARRKTNGAKFDISVALKILEREARYRAEGSNAAGNFSVSVRML